MTTAAIELKDPCSLEESHVKNRQCVKKQRHHFSNKGWYSQSYGFSSSYVQTWELGHKEGWEPKNWCFCVGEDSWVSIGLQGYIYQPQSLNLSLAPPYPLVIINLLSATLTLFLFCKYVHVYPFLDSKYEWCHMIFIFLCPTYFTYYDSLKVQPCCYKWHHFSLFVAE